MGWASKSYSTVVASDPISKSTGGADGIGITLSVNSTTGICGGVSGGVGGGVGWENACWARRARLRALLKMLRWGPGDVGARRQRWMTIYAMKAANATNTKIRMIITGTGTDSVSRWWSSLKSVWFKMVGGLCGKAGGGGAVGDNCNGRENVRQLKLRCNSICWFKC